MKKLLLGLTLFTSFSLFASEFKLPEYHAVGEVKIGFLYTARTVEINEKLNITCDSNLNQVCEMLSPGSSYLNHSCDLKRMSTIKNFFSSALANLFDCKSDPVNGKNCQFIQEPGTPHLLYQVESNPDNGHIKKYMIRNSHYELSLIHI